MNFNIRTHVTPHVSKKEAGCKCCGKYRITHFLPHVLEQIRQHVWDDTGHEIVMNIHRMASCLTHNRSLGSWYRNNRKISRITVAAKSGLAISSVISVVARADNASFAKLENQFGIIWVPDSYDGSRHVYLPEGFERDHCPDHVKKVLRDEKDSCAIDFDMRPLTPRQLADYIHIVMDKYNCDYAVLEYPKWNNPGVHFDVDTTRAGIVSKVM